MIGTTRKTCEQCGGTGRSRRRRTRRCGRCDGAGLVPYCDNCHKPMMPLCKGRNPRVTWVGVSPPQCLREGPTDTRTWDEIVQAQTTTNPTVSPESAPDEDGVVLTLVPRYTEPEPAPKLATLTLEETYLRDPSPSPLGPDPRARELLRFADHRIADLERLRDMLVERVTQLEIQLADRGDRS